MPTAICSQCQAPVYYRNTRGTRIADMTHSCGGKIVAAQYNYETKTYEPRRVESKTTGRKFQHCALCGKRRTVTGGGRVVESDTDYQVTIGGLLQGWTLYRFTVKAGSMVCWHHEPTYPVNLLRDGFRPDGLIEIG